MGQDRAQHAAAHRPTRASYARTWPSGERPCDARGTRLVSLTSSFPAISAACDRAPSIPRTGACHFSENQARAWGARFFTPAVEKVAQRPEFYPILGATPYSLRRGGISLRLRAEDPQTVAGECGTSLRMLSRPLRLRDRGPTTARATTGRSGVARRPGRDRPPDEGPARRLVALAVPSTAQRPGARLGRPAHRALFAHCESRDQAPFGPDHGRRLSAPVRGTYGARRNGG